MERLKAFKICITSVLLFRSFQEKNIVASAVLAVSAASGIASAQSTVTLHGLVDVYVGSTITKRTGVGLATKYDISKRTFLYTGLQLAKERDGIGEAKTDTFAAGVQHKF